jgi:hypothetical protein
MISLLPTRYGNRGPRLQYRSSLDENLPASGVTPGIDAKTSTSQSTELRCVSDMSSKCDRINVVQTCIILVMQINLRGLLPTSEIMCHFFLRETSLEVGFWPN